MKKATVKLKKLRFVKKLDFEGEFGLYDVFYVPRYFIYDLIRNPFTTDEKEEEDDVESPLFAFHQTIGHCLATAPSV